ncbi:MAG: iron-containing redox enzyme family protein [Actinobacteria bacterium]|nr:iron-containing redox enzyme family protein [Actinomycetota bacterium]
MWRALYRSAGDPEAFFEAGYLRTVLRAVGNAAEPAPEPADTVQRALSWAADQRAEFDRVLAEAAGGTEVVAALLGRSLPMASALGCWLQNLSAPGVFEDEVQLRLMALLADDIGVGRPEASRYDEFRLLLGRERLTGLAVGVGELADLAAVPEELYALPAVLQALSRRSDAFAFELVGVDHVARSLGMLPCWAALRPHRPGAIDWSRLDLSVADGFGELGDPVAVSSRIVAACAALGPEPAARVAAGAAWFADAVRQWSERVLHACRQALDPEQAMAALVRARAREGAVYHQDYLLERRPLSGWLREAQQDPAPFLRALAASRLVKPGNSARSLLVNGLVGVRGRMFRIFSPEDLAVLRRWIDQLPPRADQPNQSQPNQNQSDQNQSDQSRPDRSGPSSYPVPGPPPAVSPDLGVSPADVRQAYFLLQGRALEPRTRAFALDYVRQWLELAERSLESRQSGKADQSGQSGESGRAEQSLPAEWTPDGLRPWLMAQHDRHDEQFQQLTGADEALPEREAVIDSSLQLAPLTLIDGSWLQGYTDVHLASSRIGAPLFQTYWDELGNGQLELNHPKIYRDNLADMGVTLAPTASWEFAHDPRLREESLRLPVYWLCLGKLPVTFRPEILGMNLAMELSGVGGSYRSARRFLLHYGYSTRFVDIHNTIDNVSTGHSAWAADAIDTYLRTHPSRTDAGWLAAEWHRIRVGYESLAPVQPKRGALSVLRRSRQPFAGREQTSVDPAQPRLHHPPIRMSA